MIRHPIPPFFDAQSDTLILGSFPSVRSRQQGFFYGHPQNRFWKVLALIYGVAEPQTIGEKQGLLREKRLALWDVIAACDIEGSADSSIQNVIPNDLRPLLQKSAIRRIFVNGKTAEKLYRQYLEPALGRKAAVLPSTSPANAAWNLARLEEAWKIIRGENQ